MIGVETRKIGELFPRNSLGLGVSESIQLCLLRIVNVLLIDYCLEHILFAHSSFRDTKMTKPSYMLIIWLWLTRATSIRREAIFLHRFLLSGNFTIIILLGVINVSVKPCRFNFLLNNLSVQLHLWIICSSVSNLFFDIAFYLKYFPIFSSGFNLRLHIFEFFC